MGHFYYSTVKTRLTVERVERDLQQIATEFWGPRFRVERVEGLPISRADDRKAKWCFMWTGPAKAGYDAAFSVLLLRDGRLEFKVPLGGEGGPGYADQQRVRRRLVRLYNSV